MVSGWRLSGPVLTPYQAMSIMEGQLPWLRCSMIKITFEILIATTLDNLCRFWSRVACDTPSSHGHHGKWQRGKALSVVEAEIYLNSRWQCCVSCLNLRRSENCSSGIAHCTAWTLKSEVNQFIRCWRPILWICAVFRRIVFPPPPQIFGTRSASEWSFTPRSAAAKPERGLFSKTHQGQRLKVYFRITSGKGRGKWHQRITTDTSSSYNKKNHAHSSLHSICLRVPGFWLDQEVVDQDVDQEVEETLFSFKCPGQQLQQ